MFNVSFISTELSARVVNKVESISAIFPEIFRRSFKMFLCYSKMKYKLSIEARQDLSSKKMRYDSLVFELLLSVYARRMRSLLNNRHFEIIYCELSNMSGPIKDRNLKCLIDKLEKRLCF